MFSILIATAMAAVINSQMIVSTPWLADHATDPTLVILDVGTPAEYWAGHIPGARMIDRKELIVEHRGRSHDELPLTRDLAKLFTNAGVVDAHHIIVYSRDPLLATRAFFTLDYVGLGDRVSILDGGYAKWVAEGRTVSTEPTMFKSVEFKPRLNRKIVASQPMVKIALKHATSTTLIDARPSMEYTGNTTGKEIARPGRIPLATSVPWTINITKDEPPVFANADRLTSIYKEAGVTTDKPTIIYCRTGMEGSMTYFVLRYLGYQPQLYDGSYDEWHVTERVVNMAQQ